MSVCSGGPTLVHRILIHSDHWVGVGASCLNCLCVPQAWHPRRQICAPNEEENQANLHPYLPIPSLYGAASVDKWPHLPQPLPPHAGAGVQPLSGHLLVLGKPCSMAGWVCSSLFDCNQLYDRKRLCMCFRMCFYCTMALFVFVSAERLTESQALPPHRQMHPLTKNGFPLWNSPTKTAH